MTQPIDPRDVLDFWFAAGKEKWFAKSDDFDAEITARFKQAHEAARGGAHDAWADSAEGMLALIILLDQFPRNMYRGSPDMFAADPKAAEMARLALEKKVDGEVPQAARAFVYMPLMHSEDLEDQELCVRLFKGDPTLKDNVAYAVDHRDIVKRFGRFPHRNIILGRATTAEEQQFLDEGGFAG
ncbi:MAG: DUF924 domain-containing protein [Alphaproteobacteria bacterium]|nr:DUF924 domain-containing protein [Alphaproteobacteria bacterium]